MPSDKQRKGADAERTAARYLHSKGFNIIKMNYRIRGGEIDIVAELDECIVFVEVKYRENTSYGLPRESVGYNKQQRLIKAATMYIAKNNLSGRDMRFDVVEFLLQNNQLYVNHIENAFST